MITFENNYHCHANNIFILNGCGFMYMGMFGKCGLFPGTNILKIWTLCKLLMLLLVSSPSLQIICLVHLAERQKAQAQVDLRSRVVNDLGATKTL